MVPETLTLPSRRSVNQNAHPDLVEAVSITRFWRSVSIADSSKCWNWLGDSHNGYGVFYYQGRMRPAHELALSFSTGESRPDGFDTCHSCDNPSCCNPAHLRFGTRQSNVDDMYDRDRALTGERHPQAKLTDRIVFEMRTRRAHGARQKDLAAEYGISAAYVSDIVNGLIWQQAGGPITGRSKRTQRNSRSKRKKLENG